MLPLQTSVGTDAVWLEVLRRYSRAETRAAHTEAPADTRSAGTRGACPWGELCWHRCGRISWLLSHGAEGWAGFLKICLPALSDTSSAIPGTGGVGQSSPHGQMTMGRSKLLSYWCHETVCETLWTLSSSWPSDTISDLVQPSAYGRQRRQGPSVCPLEPGGIAW